MRSQFPQYGHKSLTPRSESSLYCLHFSHRLRLVRHRCFSNWQWLKSFLSTECSPPPASGEANAQPQLLQWLRLTACQAIPAVYERTHPLPRVGLVNLTLDDLHSRSCCLPFLPLPHSTTSAQRWRASVYVGGLETFRDAPGHVGFKAGRRGWYSVRSCWQLARNRFDRIAQLVRKACSWFIALCLMCYSNLPFEGS
jgi:hypothetical protein